MKIRCRLLAWCLVFLLPAAAHAANTLFWKVTSPGGGTVYLLGSLHAATPDIYPLPSAIEAAFRDADCLVLEADPSTGLENMMGSSGKKGCTPAAGRCRTISRRTATAPSPKNARRAGWTSSSSNRCGRGWPR